MTRLGGRAARSIAQPRDHLLFLYVDVRRTFSARGPFGPWPTSNSTLSPSRRSSRPSPYTALWWKKYSFPASPLMNPNPLSTRNVRIFPVIIAPRRIVDCRGHVLLLGPCFVGSTDR